MVRLIQENASSSVYIIKHKRSNELKVLKTYKLSVKDRFDRWQLLENVDIEKDAAKFVAKVEFSGSIIILNGELSGSKLGLVQPVYGENLKLLLMHNPIIVKIPVGREAITLSPDAEKLLAAAYNVLKQGVASLEALHDAGLVHRDVKPENFQLDRRIPGENLLDALASGHATIVLNDHESLGDPEQKIGWGTDPYLPPARRISRNAKVSYSSDHFALAQVIGEWIFGMSTFEAYQTSAPRSAHEALPPDGVFLSEVLHGERFMPFLEDALHRLELELLHKSEFQDPKTPARLYAIKEYLLAANQFLEGTRDEHLATLETSAFKPGIKHGQLRLVEAPVGGEQTIPPRQCATSRNHMSWIKRLLQFGFGG